MGKVNEEKDLRSKSVNLVYYQKFFLVSRGVTLVWNVGHGMDTRETTKRE